MGKILSVSVAAYNVQNYLEKLLSVIGKNDKIDEFIEFVIVNDGSKDDTLKIAKEYEKKYPQSIKVIDKNNGGYGSTINAAIKQATGKYFKVLDGDDWFDSGNLLEFIEFLIKSTTDIVISPYEVVYESNNEIEIIDKHQGNGEIEIFAMHELCIKTDLLKEAKYEITEKCFYTDTEFALLVLNIGNTFSKFEKPVYCYRVGVEGQSMSLEGRKKHCKDSKLIAIKLIEIYNSKKFSEDIKFAVQKQLIISIIFAFQSLSLLQTRTAVFEIKELDNKIKVLNHNIYNELDRASRTLHFIHIIHFWPKSLVVYLLRKTMK